MSLILTNTDKECNNNRCKINRCKRSSTSEDFNDDGSHCNGGKRKKSKRPKYTNGVVRRTSKRKHTDPAKRETLTMMLMSRPGRVQMHGLLSRQTPTHIYLHMSRNIFRFLSSQGFDYSGAVHFVEAMSNFPKDGGSSDMKAVNLIQGYAALANLHVSNKKHMKKLKALEQTLTNTDIDNERAVFTLLNYQLFCSYVHTNKLGKAYSRWAKAKRNVDFMEPSVWTAQAMEAEGMMHLLLSHLQSYKQQDHLQKAFECYQLARDHCSSGDTVMNQSKSAYYFMQMIYIKLKVPVFPVLMQVNLKTATSGSLGGISKTQISEKTLQEADKMFEYAKNHYESVIGKDIMSNVHLFLCHVYLRIRKAQQVLNSNNFEVALDYIQNTVQFCYTWHARYQRFTRGQRSLAVDHTTKVLEDMESDIALKRMVYQMRSSLDDIDTVEECLSPGVMDCTCTSSSCADEETEQELCLGPRRESTDSIFNDETYDQFESDMMRLKNPGFLIGFHQGTNNPSKIYVDIEKGSLQKARSFFETKFPDLMEDEVLQLQVQDSFKVIMPKGFSNIALIDDLKKCNAFPTLQEGSVLASVDRENITEIMQNEDITRIEDIARAYKWLTAVGSLSCFMRDQHNKLHAITAWHPLKGFYDEDSKNINTNPGEMTERYFPVVGEIKGSDSQGKIVHISNVFNGGHCITEGPEKEKVLIDVAALEIQNPEELMGEEIASLFCKNDAGRNVQLKPFKGSLKVMTQVQKVGCITKKTNGFILNPRYVCYLGDTPCKGAFLVRQVHTPNFATHGDSGSLVTDRLTSNVVDAYAYGICYSISDSYTSSDGVLQEGNTAEQVIRTVCCLRLDSQLDYLKKKYDLELNFMTSFSDDSGLGSSEPQTEVDGDSASGICRRSKKKRKRSSGDSAHDSSSA